MFDSSLDLAVSDSRLAAITVSLNLYPVSSGSIGYELFANNCQQATEP